MDRFAMFRWRWPCAFAALLAALTLAACSTPNPMSVRAEGEVTGKGTAGPVTVAGAPVTPTYKIDGWAKVVAQYPEVPHLTIDGDYTTTVNLAPNPAAVSYPADAVLIRVPYPAQQVKGVDTLPAGVVRTEPNAPSHNSPALARPPAPPPGMAALPLPAGGHYSGGCNDPAVSTCAVPSTRVEASKPNACAVPAAPKVSAPNVNACAKPIAIAAPFAARPCGTPVYIGCSGVEGGNRPTPGPTYKPRPPCAKKAGLGGTCLQGVPAVVQGLLDILQGKFV